MLGPAPSLDLVYLRDEYSTGGRHGVGVGSGLSLTLLHSTGSDPRECYFVRGSLSRDHQSCLGRSVF